MANKNSSGSKFPKWVLAIVSVVVVVLGILGYVAESTGGNASPIYKVLNAIDTIFYGGPTTPDPTMPTSGEVKVNIIDVGQGESILITTPQKSVLIDAGENDKGDEIMDYLNKLGLTKLDYVIATHPHADHIGGMDFVLENIDAGEVLFGAVPEKILPTTKTYEDVLSVIQAKGIPLSIVSPGDVYDLGSGATLTILGPVGDDQTDLNNCSVVSRLDFGATSFLFNGDAEEPAEKAIISANANLSATVMTMGHHGSRTSSSEPYFAAVAPDYASISCGKGNKYNHPNDETIEKLTKKGVDYYRTDLDGNIIFTSDGVHVKVNTSKPHSQE